MAAPELRPDAGFCIQVDTTSTAGMNGRWFVNMVRHKMCEMPLAYSGKVASREHILAHGIGSLQVPFDMGSFRKLKERAEGARKTTYCIDVVFNPFIVQLFMDDEFCNSMKDYRPFVINLALKRIETSLGVKLAMDKVKLVKSLWYKDGEGNSGNIPRAFTELPVELDETETAPKTASPAPAGAPVANEDSGPLIEDVTPGRKKPAIKKGFFNQQAKPLYPEGSKEGVLPENAGDPMGWMPKRLRNTCKIVDTANPEYQKNEKERRKVEATNAKNQEFNDMIKSDLTKWSKAAGANQLWSDDRPEGPDMPPEKCKYDNDYSRFDSVEDVVDEPVVDERDWYYDEKGVRRSISRASVSEANPNEAKSEPALKKGFFDNAKAALYPEGSEQRAPANEADLLKTLGQNPGLMEEIGKDNNLMKELQSMMGEMPDLGGGKQQSEKKVAAKVSTSKPPEFTLTREAEGLQLVIAVPGLESMSGVDLDVTEQSASIAFPASVGLKPLKVELSEAVIPTSVRAKFSKKNRQITVKLPVAMD
mmetsp:Transcript_128763/g.223306  ORF Transcript_128763/g.223306 Transcript_128763/m.223306 type:complete len:534 (-) Transcript_128763:233-1834(-)